LSELPAPYRNPWRQLGDDLRAIGADTRLRSWALWRRNAQGQLWSPAWWPPDLSPLFWPLLIGAGLALLLSALFWLTPRLQPSVPPPAATASEQPLALVPELPVAPEPAAEAELPEELPAELPIEMQKQISAEISDEFSAEGEELDEVSEPFVDPLVELIERPEADGLLLAAQAVPEQSLLVLQLRPAFPALSPAEQQRRALQWQGWAADLGYDHLELRDSRSGLVARDALVGEGMIVLRDRS